MIAAVAQLVGLNVKSARLIVTLTRLDLHGDPVDQVGDRVRAGWVGGDRERGGARVDVDFRADDDAVTGGVVGGV